MPGVNFIFIRKVKEVQILLLNVLFTLWDSPETKHFCLESDFISLSWIQNLLYILFRFSSMLPECVNHKIFFFFFPGYRDEINVKMRHKSGMRSLHLRQKNYKKFWTLNAYNVCNGTHNYITIVRDRVIIMTMMIFGWENDDKAKDIASSNGYDIKMLTHIFIDLILTHFLYFNAFSFLIWLVMVLPLISTHTHISFVVVVQWTSIFMTSFVLQLKLASFETSYECKIKDFKKRERKYETDDLFLCFHHQFEKVRYPIWIITEWNEPKKQGKNCVMRYESHEIRLQVTKCFRNQRKHLFTAFNLWNEIKNIFHT